MKKLGLKRSCTATSKSLEEIRAHNNAKSTEEVVRFPSAVGGDMCSATWPFPLLSPNTYQYKNDIGATMTFHGWLPVPDNEANRYWAIRP